MTPLRRKDIETGRRLERERIVAIIEERKRIHLGFIEGAHQAGVEPTAGIYIALTELKALLREI